MFLVFFMEGIFSLSCLQTVLVRFGSSDSEECMFLYLGEVVDLPHQGLKSHQCQVSSE